MNKMSKVIYRLNEGNSNNPADLLVGSEIEVKRYDDNNKVIGTMLGILELITNEYVIVRDIHTQQAYNYQFNGFNAHENGIEFNCMDDPELRFYVY